MKCWISLLKTWRTCAWWHIRSSGWDEHADMAPNQRFHNMVLPNRVTMETWGGGAVYRDSWSLARWWHCPLQEALSLTGDTPLMRQPQCQPESKGGQSSFSSSDLRKAQRLMWIWQNNLNVSVDFHFKLCFNIPATNKLKRKKLNDVNASCNRLKKLKISSKFNVAKLEQQQKRQ